MIAFLNGFGLGFSLILAIGAQNSFVLRQGLRRQHVTLAVLFCGFSDAFLIALGVGGVALTASQIVGKFQVVMAWVAAAWLFSYALMHFRSAWKADYDLSISSNGIGVNTTSWQAVVVTLAMLTFVNPHVYLDTLILIGSFSLAYDAIGKWHYAMGAMTASFVFFGLLGYAAGFCSRYMTSARHWQRLDILIGIIMLILSVKMLLAFPV